MVQLLGRAQAEGGLVIAAAVYAELLAHPGATEQFVDEFLISTRISIDFDLGEAVWRDAAGRFGVYARRRRRSAIMANPAPVDVSGEVGQSAGLLAG
jgi:hypothetical protein